MAEKKERKLTPVGFAKWAHVHTPKEAFRDKSGRVQGDPKYQIDLCFTQDDPQWKEWSSKIMAEIKAMPQQIDKKTGEPIKKQVPIKRELDSADQPTGRFYVTFKTGDKFQPGVFDRFGIAIPESILIGNESKVRVSYTPVAYEGFGGGIALYLNAVQVLELVEYKSANAEAYGFEVEKLPDTSKEQQNPFDDFQSDKPFDDGDKIPF